LVAGVLFASVLFASVLFASVLFASVLFAGVLFAGVLFAGVLFAGVLFAGVLFAGVIRLFVIFGLDFILDGLDLLIESLDFRLDGIVGIGRLIRDNLAGIRSPQEGNFDLVGGLRGNTTLAGRRCRCPRLGSNCINPTSRVSFSPFV
jgi:hypothetical protein